MIAGSSADERLLPIYVALGALSAKSSSLETTVGIAIAFLSQPGDVDGGVRFFAKLMFKRRIQTLKKVLEQRFASTSVPVDFRERLAEMESVCDERNSFVHSFYWAPAYGQLIATRVKFQMDGTPTCVELHPEEIRSLVERTEALDNGFIGLMQQHFSTPYTDYAVQVYSRFGPSVAGENNPTQLRPLLTQ